MNPVAEVVLIQVVQQLLVSIIQAMQKAGMTPEQQAAVHADLISRLRNLQIELPPSG